MISMSTAPARSALALVAGERGFVVLELDHDVAVARLALHRLEGAAAHPEFRVVFAEHRREGGAVGFGVFGFDHIDAPDPISLRHVVLLIFAFSNQMEPLGVNCSAVPMVASG